jgi:hypothetical protein
MDLEQITLSVNPVILIQVAGARISGAKQKTLRVLIHEKKSVQFF